MMPVSEVKATGVGNDSLIPRRDGQGMWDARLRALHRATLSLVNDLDLERVLERIVSAAKDLADAGYAALGLPDGKGGLATFVTAGVGTKKAAQTPTQP